MSFSAPEPLPTRTDILPNRKPCPMCGGEVLPAAKVCRYCGEELVAATVDDIWRDGDFLVLLKNAGLPSRCLVTNEHAVVFQEREFSWRPARIYWLTVPPPEHTQLLVGISQRRLLLKRTAVGLFFTATLVFIAATTNSHGPEVPCATLLMMVGLLIWNFALDRDLTPARITHEHIWLRGVHPEFLEELPPWPGDAQEK